MKKLLLSLLTLALINNFTTEEIFAKDKKKYTIFQLWMLVHTGNLCRKLL